MDTEVKFDNEIPNLKFYNRGFMGRKLKKTAKIKPQNIKAELNNFNTNERYLREWSEINKELTLKSNKNIDMATESSKLIYNLINETTD